MVHGGAWCFRPKGKLPFSKLDSRTMLTMLTMLFGFNGWSFRLDSGGNGLYRGEKT